MYFLFFIFLFLAGIAVGSFLNVVICRIGKEDGIISGRSHCLNCKKKLNWYELIPIFSFLIQKRKCRGCDQKISWQYLIVEFATGILFVMIFKFYSHGILPEGGQFLNLTYHLLIVSLLIVIFVYDLKHYIIPNKTVYFGIIISAVYLLFIKFFSLSVVYYPLSYYFFSGFIAALFFLLMVLVSRGRWMGMGDVKLVLLMGLFLGWPKILIALLVAFWSGALVGIILIFLKKKGLKEQIPFGPFLVSGTILSLFISDYFLKDYLDFLIR